MKALPRDKDKSMVQERQNFIDWFKAAGMFLIVFGHVFGDPFNQFTYPVYPKQLGVVCFIFVLGWSLSSEKRPPLQVLYYRLFPMYFWGISSALLLSGIIFFLKDDLNLSNYLPFALGINTFLNYFPANPTTWFIGLYIHLVLIGVALHGRIRPSHRLILFLLLFEVMFRALIAHQGKLFIAYMLPINWLTIFALGMYFQQQKEVVSHSKITFVKFFIWGVFLFSWARLFHHLSLEKGFPFNTVLVSTHPFINSLVTSGSVSLVYVVNVLFAFFFFKALPGVKTVRFFASNTLIIFIWHMPLIYAIHEWWYTAITDFWLKKCTLIIFCYVGLGLISHLIHHIIDVKQIRNRSWECMRLFLPASGIK